MGLGWLSCMYPAAFGELLRLSSCRCPAEQLCPPPAVFRVLEILRKEKWGAKFCCRKTSIVSPLVIHSVDSFRLLDQAGCGGTHSDPRI